jgi:hypothetical protein
MKTFLSLFLMANMSMALPSIARADAPSNNTLLSKEIKSIVKRNTPEDVKASYDVVTIRFLINAQNELVIFEATGQNEATCQRVKEILNYRQVKYKSAKQLVPYEISIRFMPEAEPLVRS